MKVWLEFMVIIINIYYQFQMELLENNCELLGFMHFEIEMEEQRNKNRSADELKLH